MIEKVVIWLINLLSDYLKARSKGGKDIQYLCSHIVVSLDRFFDGCVSVVGDDGLCCGQPDQNGYHVVQVDDPTLDFESKNEELKLLPTDTMHEIVQFPREVELANAMISGAAEHASPPEYDEAFEERQYQYAKLGLKANALSTQLRALASMPLRDYGDWDALNYLDEKLLKIKNIRDIRAENNARFLEGFRKVNESA